MRYFKYIIGAFMKNLMKKYLKRLTKEQRDLRGLFVGKRLKHKQYIWLHYNDHPWESPSKEEGNG